MPTISPNQAYRELNNMPSLLTRNIEEGAATIENYDFQELLGAGSFAKVFKCVERKTRQEFAAKELKSSDGEDEEKIEQEIKVWQNLRHGNIVSLYTAVRDGDTFYLIMDFIDGGSLFDEIIRQTIYSEEQACRVTKQLLTALDYLHSRRIVHRDIKPDNLLLQRSRDGHDVTIKLTDFGLAQVLPDDSDVISCGASGAPLFLAPETILEEPIGCAVDTWASGVILYLLLVGYPPFWSSNDEQLLLSILRGQYTMPSPYWNNVSDGAKDLVRRLIVPQPGERMTASQALGHPIMSDLDLKKDKPKEGEGKRHFFAVISGIRAMIKFKRANIKSVSRRLSEKGTDLEAIASPRSPRPMPELDEKDSESFAADSELLPELNKKDRETSVLCTSN